MAIVFVCSTFLPQNQLPEELIEEYERERKARLYAKQKAKRGLRVPEVTSFIGRSHEAALQKLLQDLQKVAPAEGFKIRTFQGDQPPPENGPGLEGFVRTLQIQQGTGLLGYSTNTAEIVMGEGPNRAQWKFLVIFMR